MSTGLAIMSFLIIVLSLYGAVLPLKLTSFVQGFIQHPGSLWIAVLVRLLLAVMLWFAAPASHTPTTLKVLAGLALLAAIVLAAMGPVRLTNVIDYFASKPPIFMRLQCLIGVAFGVFLLWSIQSFV